MRKTRVCEVERRSETAQVKAVKRQAKNGDEIITNINNRYKCRYLSIIST